MPDVSVLQHPECMPNHHDAIAEFCSLAHADDATQHIVELASDDDAREVRALYAYRAIERAVKVLHGCTYAGCPLHRQSPAAQLLTDLLDAEDAEDAS